jgi:hypothetical protein
MKTETPQIMTVLTSQRFSHWDYAADRRELVHRRSGERIALDVVLRNGDTMAGCIFQVHDQPWGTAQVLDELVELLGTYFKGEQVIRQHRAAEVRNSDLISTVQ